MARTTKAESDATARRVLDAAAALFAQRGFAAVGLEQVAAQAGVTRGAVYHHFAGKQALFGAVASAAQARVGERVAAVAESHADDWDGLVAGCREFLAAIVSDDARRILLIDAPAVLGWDTWRAQDSAESGRHLRDALADLAATGTIVVGSVEGAAALLSGALNEAALVVAGDEHPDARLDALWPDVERMLGAFRA